MLDAVPEGRYLAGFTCLSHFSGFSFSLCSLHGCGVIDSVSCPRQGFQHVRDMRYKKWCYFDCTSISLNLELSRKWWVLVTGFIL